MDIELLRIICSRLTMRALICGLESCSIYLNAENDSDRPMSDQGNHKLLPTLARTKTVTVVRI